MSPRPEAGSSAAGAPAATASALQRVARALNSTPKAVGLGAVHAAPLSHRDVTARKVSPARAVLRRRAARRVADAAGEAEQRDATAVPHNPEQHGKARHQPSRHVPMTHESARRCSMHSLPHARERAGRSASGEQVTRRFGVATCSGYCRAAAWLGPTPRRTAAPAGGIGVAQARARQHTIRACQHQSATRAGVGGAVQRKLRAWHFFSTRCDDLPRAAPPVLRRTEEAPPAR